jgi:hypothetical protein
MAYVAISNQLMDEVRSKIMRMKDAERNSVPEVNAQLSYQTIPLQYEQLLWGEHYDLKDKLPSAWKRELNELCGTAEYMHGERMCKSRLYLKAAIKISAPPDASSYTAHFIMPADHPDMAPIVERDKQYADIESKWTTLHNKIRDFLNNCKSLNEAVKLWPDVRVYIPDTYMKRMLAKSERTAEKISKASEFLKQIDTDHAIAAAVSARMAGAKV